MRKLVLAALVAAPSMASAVTMDGDCDFGSYPAPCQSGRFVFQNSSTYVDRGLYLHDDDGGIWSSTIRTRDRRLFNVSSIRFYGGGSSAYVTGSGPRPDEWSDEFSSWATDRSVSGADFRLTGYRGGSIVASVDIDLANGLEYSLTGFRRIRRLVAELLPPPGTNLGQRMPWDVPLTSDTAWCNEYCAGVQIADIGAYLSRSAQQPPAVAMASSTTPAPVPLPPALALLLGGLAAMFRLSSRSRGAAAAQ